MIKSYGNSNGRLVSKLALHLIASSVWMQIMIVIYTDCTSKLNNNLLDLQSTLISLYKEVPIDFSFNSITD